MAHVEPHQTESGSQKPSSSEYGPVLSTSSADRALAATGSVVSGERVASGCSFAFLLRKGLVNIFFEILFFFVALMVSLLFSLLRNLATLRSATCQVGLDCEMPVTASAGGTEDTLCVVERCNILGRTRRKSGWGWGRGGERQGMRVGSKGTIGKRGTRTVRARTNLPFAQYKHSHSHGHSQRVRVGTDNESSPQKGIRGLRRRAPRG